MSAGKSASKLDALQTLARNSVTVCNVCREAFGVRPGLPALLDATTTRDTISHKSRGMTNCFRRNVKAFTTISRELVNPRLFVTLTLIVGST